MQAVGYRMNAGVSALPAMEGPECKRSVGGESHLQPARRLLRLPNAKRRIIPLRKVTDYLLQPMHATGGSKARFFLGLGFTPGKSEVLLNALGRIAETGIVIETVGTPFGTKYVVTGRLETPLGQGEPVTTVWIVLTGEDLPRFVTAYPART